jgi:hypothetical protein
MVAGPERHRRWLAMVNLAVGDGDRGRSSCWRCGCQLGLEKGGGCRGEGGVASLRLGRQWSVVASHAQWRAEMVAVRNSEEGKMRKGKLYSATRVLYRRQESGG